MKVALLFSVCFLFLGLYLFYYDQQPVLLNKAKPTRIPMIPVSNETLVLFQKKIEHIKKTKKKPSAKSKTVEEELWEGERVQQIAEDYAAEYKKELVREFLKNAKKDGYDIKLNKDLEIISIQKKRKKGPLLFEEIEE